MAAGPPGPLPLLQAKSGPLRQHLPWQPLAHTQQGLEAQSCQGKARGWGAVQGRTQREGLAQPLSLRRPAAEAPLKRARPKGQLTGPVFMVLPPCGGRSLADNVPWRHDRHAQQRQPPRKGHSKLGEEVPLPSPSLRQRQRWLHRHRGGAEENPSPSQPQAAALLIF